MNAQLPDLPTAPNFLGLRLSKKTVLALEAMAWDGATMADAAAKAGIRMDNLRRAFDLPSVKLRWRVLQRYVRQREGEAALARISKLSREAVSEHVRLEASKWLAGVEGVAPVARVQASVTHRHTFGFDYPQLIEGEAEELPPSDPAALIED